MQPMHASDRLHEGNVISDFPVQSVSQSSQVKVLKKYERREITHHVWPWDPWKVDL